MSARVWCRPDRAGQLAWTKHRLPTRDLLRRADCFFAALILQPPDCLIHICAAGFALSKPDRW